MLWLAPFLVTTLIILLAYLDTRKPKNYPPGPRWLPFFGNGLQVYLARSRLGSFCRITAELAQKYGPIIGLKIGNEKMVIVYGPDKAKDMFLSDDLQGRPIGPYYDMRTWNKRRGILLTDSEFWQEQRRFIVRHLREFGFGTKNMSVMIEDEVDHLLEFIDKNIDGNGSAVFNMETFFNVSVLNTIWRMIAGVRYSPDDPKINKLQKILADLFKAIHMVGALFSYFPILKYIAPEISGYKRYVESHESIWKFLREELDDHKKTHDPHSPRDLIDVYLNVLLEPDPADSFSEEQLLAICMDMFMAGSETTTNSLTFGFLHLMLNRSIQKKAQEEIDRVLDGRLPRLEDRVNMPYMEAIVYESIRMFEKEGFGVPHRALKDTYLGKHFIPKDVLIIVNMHGPTMGPDCGLEHPYEFDPDRYMKNGKCVIPEINYPFGFGKRRCMGEGLARANIFLFTTAILQKYDINLVAESPPDLKVLEGVTPSSSHFVSRIVPRKLYYE